VVHVKRPSAGDRDSSRKHALAREPSPFGRLAGHVGRILLWLAVGLVLVSGVRALIFPQGAPSASGDGSIDMSSPWPDDEARAFAVSATRALLTFEADSDYGRAHELAVEPYLSPHLDASALLDLPEGGPPQRVVEATVARAEPFNEDHALITVAATVEQRRSAVRYVSVPIARDARGGLAVYDLPSFSPAPATADVEPPPLEAIDPEGRAQLEPMLLQFFPIFLTGRAKELRPYLPADSTLRPLDHTYEFVELASLGQIGEGDPSAGPLIAAVKARDTESGASYALRYLLEVERSSASDSGWLVESVNGEGGEG